MDTATGSARKGRGVGERHGVAGRPCAAGALLALLAALAAACGGGGYGHARSYEPTSREDDLLEGTTNVTYEEVRRLPASFRTAKLAWFGVVEEVTPTGEGRARLVLSHRTLQPRNYCADETSGSCRVTVSERAGGQFIAFVALRVSDEAPGPKKLAPGSLVRVIGTPHGELMKISPADMPTSEPGVPVLEASWYRHWPRTEYVTTGASAIMRR